jgi:hypothetical protein
MNKNVKNFGKIKNAYNTILIESITSKKDENKILFKNYLKKIKEYEILREEFLVYNNIENKVETDRFKATEYVKESIALLTKYPKQSIIESNFGLFSGDTTIELGVDYDNKDLHEAITTLIFTDKKANTLDIILEATDKVVDYIMNNKPREIVENLDIPNSMLLSLSVNTFNEEYKDLNESEKTLISMLIDSTPEEKNNFIKEMNAECLTLINSRLTESDINAKEKLLSVKERLLNQKYNDESFNTDVIKLIQLKDTLKN